MRPVTLSSLRHDRPRVRQFLPVAWLAALDVDGGLSFLDVSPILTDGPDELLSVLWCRTRGTVDRREIDTDAGPLWAYLSGYRRRPGSTLRRPPSNPHARRVLRRLGMEVAYCVGAVLFTGCELGREVGLGAAQQQLLRRVAEPTPAGRAAPDLLSVSRGSGA